MEEKTHLPRRSRRNIEVFEDEAVATLGIVEQVRVRRAGLICHAPAAIDEFKLTRSDKVAHKVSRTCIELVPVALEESRFDIDEAAVWVPCEVLDNCIQNFPNGSALNGRLCAIKIFVDGF